MNRPKVSVIMPNYNNSKYIGEAIDSVLNQTYKDFELIVIDDGSTDNSLEVIDRYKDKLRLVKLAHIGYSGAVRNRGLELARGEFIAFIDSDDTWRRDKLKIQVDYLQSDCSAPIVHSNGDMVDREGKGLGTTWLNANGIKRIPVDYRSPGTCFEQVFKHARILPSTLILRRECLEKVNYFDGTLKVATDTHLMLKLAWFFNFAFIKESLVKYRIHDTSITHTFRTTSPEHPYIIVLKKFLERYPEARAELAGELENTFCASNFMYGRTLVNKNLLHEARKHFLSAIKINPFQLESYLFFLLTFQSQSQASKSRKVLRKLRSAFVKIPVLGRILVAVNHGG